MDHPSKGEYPTAEGLAARPHYEDSLAPAEHLIPQELYQQLQTIRIKQGLPKNSLRRAWSYWEYALATPEFAGDDELFRLGRADIDHVIHEENLGIHNQVRVSAEMLAAYEGPFRARANDQPITDSMRSKLQIDLGDIMLRFMGDDDLTQQQNGQLSELVAATYLLESKFFPYMGSYREECNIRREDNHDFYTLHPAERGRVKKVPLSIKFRAEQAPGVVLTLAVGRLARTAARVSPVYRKSPLDESQALRLAADIIVCHAGGESLSSEDSVFKSKLTERLSRPLEAYAAHSSVPDYASNAEALRLQIAR
jgi:hypothetical protein